MSGEVPMYYLSQGQVDQALLWVFNVYIPYGIFWLIIGFAIFSTVHEKSKSAAISGLIMAMFLYGITVLLPVEVQAYFAVICGILLFAVVYKIFR
jgi:hypothetical protein